MAKMIKKCVAIIGGIAVVTSVITGIFVVDSRYFYAAEGKAIKQQIYMMSISQERRDVQNRIWSLEDRYEKREMPQSVKEEYRKLIDRKQLLERKMEAGK